MEQHHGSVRRVITNASLASESAIMDLHAEAPERQVPSPWHDRKRCLVGCWSSRARQRMLITVVQDQLLRKELSRCVAFWRNGTTRQIVATRQIRRFTIASQRIRRYAKIAHTSSSSSVVVVIFFLGRRRCPGTPAAPQSIHILTMCKSQFIKLRYEPTGRLFGRSFVDVSVFTHTCMSMLLLQNESRWSE